MLPRGGLVLSLVQSVECYYDESESDGILCVAGYLFEKEACKEMTGRWKTILKRHALDYFHMVDCAHGTKQFKFKCKSECIEIETKLINLIKEYSLSGYACSFELKYAHLLPSALSLGIKIVSPYALCCYFALMRARSWAKEHKFKGDISYFFEAGHADHAESDMIMHAIF